MCSGCNNNSVLYQTAWQALLQFGSRQQINKFQPVINFFITSILCRWIQPGLAECSCLMSSRILKSLNCPSTTASIFTIHQYLLSLNTLICLLTRRFLKCHTLFEQRSPIKRKCPGSAMSELTFCSFLLDSLKLKSVRPFVKFE